MWEVEFYERSSGRCPAREFIFEQSQLDRKLILKDLNRLEQLGYQLRRPHAAPLRDGVYELRTTTRSGQFRLFYFFYDGSKIIVTHGLHKKQWEVPPEEIDKAIQYRADYFAQQKDKGQK